MSAPGNPQFRARLLRALVASVATGTVLLFALRAAMPAIAARLSDAQIASLRPGFNHHPWLVLGTVAFISLLLASPVLLAFRIAFGPLKGRWRR